MSKINPSIEIVGKYVNNKVKILVRCGICDHEWNPVPNSLTRGCGCPKCAGLIKTHGEFVDEMKEVNPTIKIVGQYIKNKLKVECCCLVCGNNWMVTPNSLLRGAGCPECSKRRVANAHRKTHEDFIKEVKAINPYVEILDKYVGIKTKVECLCSLCGSKWYAIPDNLLHGEGCQKCKISKGELKIENFLKNNNIDYIAQKKFDGLVGVGGKKLSYDFYIPNYKTLIEFNGAQHKIPVKYFGGEEKLLKQQEHDKRKRDFAHSHNYCLIEIPHTDFSRIEDILNDRLIFQRG